MKRIRYGVMAAAMVLAGCSPPAVTALKYDKDGLQFSYDSDWSVAKDATIDADAKIRSVRIEGPGNAVVCLICVPPDSAMTIEKYAETVAEDRTNLIKKKLSVGSFSIADTSPGSSDAATAMVSGHTQTGIHQHFSISILGNDIPHDATYFSIKGTKYRVLIVTQVAEEHLASSQDAIGLILNTVHTDGE